MKFRKHIFCTLLVLFLAGCTSPSEPKSALESTPAPSPDAVVFTDALGHEVELHRWDRVVSLYGSFRKQLYRSRIFLQLHQLFQV